jgi:hypothetical protein
VKIFTNDDPAPIGSSPVDWRIEMTAIVDKGRTYEADRAASKSLSLLLVGILAMVVGFGSMAGGVFGAWYTWDQAVVQGPFTMWAQADIITHHQLDNTDGLYYAQMDRMVPAVDENGEAVLDENGEAVMVPNEARASWFNATTLTTALSLGIVSYALAVFAFVTGLTLFGVGLVFLQIRRKAVML